MRDQDLDKLLGGFAADTLTPEEQARLYSAALADQHLFDALADEQALKELLADPAVRRRLLQALNQTNTSGTATWLDWFRRPSGLAWAGGLAATVVAVVLGTKIYEDSLKHAAPSVATEETRPSAPPAQAPSSSQQKSSPSSDLPIEATPFEAPEERAATSEASLDRVMKREQAPAPASREQRTSGSSPSLKNRPGEQDHSFSQPVPLSDESGMVAPHTSPSPHKKEIRETPASSALPHAPLSAPSRLIEPAAIAPIAKARALFYGYTDPVTTSDMQEAKQEQPLTSMAQSAPQAERPENMGRMLPQQGPVTEAIDSTTPLGLRYSFLIQEPDDRSREVSPSIALSHRGPILLTVESNQETYLQLWLTDASQPPQRLLPQKDDAQPSLKLSAGRRISVSLPLASRSITIIARISRNSVARIFEQDLPPMTRQTPDTVQESVTAGADRPRQENATYVVNQDASMDQLTVRIPFPSP
ncbi:MAG: hypothetical protein OEY86_08555 [Nitrospira sp.]|nr:hypothetical protein [Nitrospira sp.]